MDLSFFWIAVAVALIGWKIYSMRRSPEQLADIQAAVDSGAVIVDVRSPAEFASGHLPGARNVPVGEVGGLADEIDGLTAIVYCASGTRSARAASKLRSAGVQVLDLGTLRNGQMLRFQNKDAPCQ